MGEIFAIITAATWAIAVVLFKKSGEQVHPIALNFFKNILAIFLFIPTVFIFGETLFRKAPAGDYLVLLLSGSLGIAISDTLYFMALNSIGAGLTAIVVCLYSPFIIALSLVFLGDRLGLFQYVGVGMILLAVLSAAYIKEESHISKAAAAKGIFLGALATLFNAVGVVMIKPILNTSPLVWVSTVRIFGGVVTLALILLMLKNRNQILGTLKHRKAWGFTIGGSFMGAYLSMFLWLAGMKYTLTSIAAALNQTSTVFIYFFAVIFLKEEFSLRRIFGVALAIIGVVLITFTK